MLFFWILIVGSLLIVGSIMGYLAWLARQVPDASERHTRLRLNPDQLRMLAYLLMVIICLIAAVYELQLWYGG